MSATGRVLRSVARRGYRLAFVAEWERAVERSGLAEARGFDALLAHGERLPGGRGDHRRIPLDDGSGAIRVRLGRHGGWLAPLTGDRFLRPDGVLRELALWLELRERGVALPTPVAAVARRRGPFWRTAFAALERPEALDAEAWLRRHPDASDRRRLARALGRAIRRLHDTGTIHGDLQLRNVLVEQEADGPTCRFVDLDHARRFAALPPARRMAELMRLLRSVEKRGHGALVASPSWLPARLLLAYCGGDRRLRSALIARGPAESRRLRRHRLAWWLRRHVLATLGAAAWLRALSLALLLLGCSAEGDGATPSALADGSAPATRWSLLALGDTGREPSPLSFLGGQLRVAEAMVAEAEHRPVDAIALLGDNFYWDGLDREHLVARIRHNLVRPYCAFLALDGRRSHEVADACRDRPARLGPVPIFAVLGNHDLKQPESPRLQRDAVPLFLPGWRMSAGLATPIEVAPGLSLVLFESEPAIREPERMKQALRDALQAARGPWRILLAHRPIATDDLGGVPLGGYPSWVREAIAESGRTVQLALMGHHHNLQVFELTEPTRLVQIGAGSGGDVRGPLASPDHPDARFGVLSLGFARVDLVGGASDEGERLVVTLVEVPDRLSWRRALGERRTRFEVDREGRLGVPGSG